MKRKLGTYLPELRRGLGRVVRRYPVEVALQTVLTALVVWWTEAEHFPLFPAACLWAFPLFSLGALVVNTLAGRTPWRRVYWVVWTPLVPLLLWPGLQAWVATEQFAITIGILAPLALLLCRRARDNRRFAGDAAIYLRAAAVALIFSGIACGLFNAVLWSAAYIFGFDDVHWVERLSVDTWPVANLLAAPVLFLLLLDRWEEREYSLNRIGAALVNWIFTPALVIYAVMLHLYAARILVLWSLPRGGVAYLVFGFVLLAFAVRMLRELVEKRVAEWFYGRFGCFLLVPVLLFWIGAARRIGEYGLTASRIYLLVCGVIMTLAVLFFFLRSGRYVRLFAAAFVLFAAVAYIPPLSPERIGLSSQRARFERLGRELGMLDAGGRFVERRIAPADSTRRADYAEFFSAMQYVDLRDSTFRASLGLGKRSPWGLEQELCPWKSAETVTNTNAFDAVLPRNARIEPDAAYPHLYTHIAHWGSDDEGLRWDGDSIRLTLGGRRLVALSGRELVQRQMERAGATFEELPELDDERRLRLLEYRTEEVRIVFRSLEIERRDSAILDCAGVEAELVMTR